MVFSPRSMEIRITFEDRSYKLGETIDLTIEVDPAREVRVRSGTLELMLEERLSEAKMGRQMGVGAPAPSRVVRPSGPPITSRCSRHYP